MSEKYKYRIGELYQYLIEESGAIAEKMAMVVVIYISLLFRLFGWEVFRERQEREERDGREKREMGG